MHLMILEEHKKGTKYAAHSIYINIIRFTWVYADALKRRCVSRIWTLS